ncbi:hypothetical protein B0H12DRAFT_1121413 [Mycena haematopus]|nr:hypothetical protein B0H12DRAFT_1121413 [Mycena haematopus]
MLQGTIYEIGRQRVIIWTSNCPGLLSLGSKNCGSFSWYIPSTIRHDREHGECEPRSSSEFLQRTLVCINLVYDLATRYLVALLFSDYDVAKEALSMEGTSKQDMAKAKKFGRKIKPLKKTCGCETLSGSRPRVQYTSLEDGETVIVEVRPFDKI